MDNILLGKITELIDQRIDKYFNTKKQNRELGNRYVDGVIMLANADGTYNVKINGEISIIKARTGLTFAVNDIVLVCIVNGDFSHKFIDMKRPY